MDTCGVQYYDTSKGVLLDFFFDVPKINAMCSSKSFPAINIDYADTETQRLILPTLKTAIDFYYGDDAFVYLEQAQQLCNDEDNQLESVPLILYRIFLLYHFVSRWCCS